MKKPAPGPAGGQRGVGGSSDAKDLGLGHKEEASSSAAIAEDLHGFTPASEIYSVRSAQFTPSPARFYSFV